jgi:Lon protease-like protein
VALTLLPLFPLGTVLYPGVLLPLHIFEDRYRQLIRDLLAQPAGPRRFGVVAIKEGREVGTDGVTALHEIGCTAELQRVEAYDDGRFDIIAVGASRFRLVRVDASQPLVGEVELLPDVCTDEATRLSGRAVRMFGSYRKALLTAQGLAVNEPPELPDDPVERSYLIAAAMLVEMSDKQYLLATSTVDERLTLEMALLRRESALVSQLSTRPAVEFPRAGYSPN